MTTARKPGQCDHEGRDCPALCKCDCTPCWERVDYAVEIARLEVENDRLKYKVSQWTGHMGQLTKERDEAREMLADANRRLEEIRSVVFDDPEDNMVRHVSGPGFPRVIRKGRSVSVVAPTHDNWDLSDVIADHAWIDREDT